MSNIKYIMKTVEGFDKKQNMTILKFLQDMNSKIVESGDGSRVNLDKLNKNNITKLKRKVKEINTPVEEKYCI